MCVFQALGDLDAIVERLLDRELLVDRLQLGQLARQRASRQVLEDQEPVFVRLFDAMDRRYVGVIEGGNRARFLLKTCHLFVGAEQVRVQELERDKARETPVASLINRSE